MLKVWLVENRFIEEEPNFGWGVSVKAEMGFLPGIKDKFLSTELIAA